MAQLFSELLKDGFTQAFYPKVTGNPRVVIFIISFPGAGAEKFKETLYSQLPRYWSSQGIVDCKILFASNSNTAVLIESWEQPEAAEAFRQSRTWTGFYAQLKAMGTQIEPIVNDSFELIE